MKCCGSGAGQKEQGLSLAGYGLTGVCSAQTLKGNIRVFCRVRPVAADKPEVEALDNGQPVISFLDTGIAPSTYTSFLDPRGSSSALHERAFVQNCREQSENVVSWQHLGLSCAQK
jgi:hypothetical protein